MVNRNAVSQINLKLFETFHRQVNNLIALFITPGFCSKYVWLITFRINMKLIRIRIEFEDVLAIKIVKHQHYFESKQFGKLIKLTQTLIVNAIDIFNRQSFSFFFVYFERFSPESARSVDKK